MCVGIDPRHRGATFRIIRVWYVDVETGKEIPAPKWIRVPRKRHHKKARTSS